MNSGTAPQHGQPLSGRRHHLLHQVCRCQEFDLIGPSETVQTSTLRETPHHAVPIFLPHTQPAHSVGQLRARLNLPVDNITDITVVPAHHNRVIGQRGHGTHHKVRMQGQQRLVSHQHLQRPVAQSRHHVFYLQAGGVLEQGKGQRRHVVWPGQGSDIFHAHFGRHHVVLKKRDCSREVSHSQQQARTLLRQRHACDAAWHHLDPLPHFEFQKDGEVALRVASEQQSRVGQGVVCSQHCLHRGAFGRKCLANGPIRIPQLQRAVAVAHHQHLLAFPHEEGRADRGRLPVAHPVARKFLRKFLGKIEMKVLVPYVCAVLLAAAAVATGKSSRQLVRLQARADLPAGADPLQGAGPQRHRRDAWTAPGSKNHTLPGDGDGFYLIWTSTAAPDMLVHLLDHTVFPNLFTTPSPYVDSFSPASGVMEPIAHARLSSDVTVPFGNPVVWVYALTNNTHLYVSINNGQNFDQLSTARVYNELMVHPTKPNVFAGLVNSQGAPEGVYDVYMVTVPTPVMPLQTLSDTNVAHGVSSPQFLDSGELVFTHNNDTYRYSDQGSISVVLKNVDTIINPDVGEFVFGISVDPQSVFNDSALYVSRDGAKMFSTAMFPTDGHELSYEILDASENDVVARLEAHNTAVMGDFTIEAQSAGGQVGINTTKADFSPDFNDEVTADVQLVYAPNMLGCDVNDPAYPNVTGKMVMIDRGDCFFVHKINNAESLGAVSVIIANYDNTTLRMIAPKDEQLPGIPAFIVTQAQRMQLQTLLAAGPVTVHVVQQHIREQSLSFTSHLYLSNFEGIKFSSSLKDVVTIADEGGTDHCDFYKVQSQNGTYLANYYSDTGVQTVLTFNKGAVWHPLGSVYGVVTQENHVLTLVLAGASQLTGIPEPETTAQAAGLIIANGFYSLPMDYWDTESINYTQVAVYVSNDGGFNWRQVLQGPHSYVVLDHGGVIAALPLDHTTDSVWFSVDAGHNWQSTAVVSSPLWFDGFLAMPGGATTLVYLYYLQSVNGVHLWQGLTLNFMATLGQPCQPSDYEQYQPTNYDGSDLCQLGVHLNITRRKTTSVCFNGNAYETAVDGKACACGTDDLMCEYGFFRASLGQQLCVRDNEVTLGCTELAYDKIADDLCATSDQFEQTYLQPVSCHPPTPVPTATPSSGGGDGGGSHAAAIAAGVVVAGLAIAAIGLLYMKRNTLCKRSSSAVYLQQHNDEDDDEMLVS
eukprot:m.183961 g.183961  ORF g.183961 m.183961 type:complete len:1209 (-) comp21535_c0_seq2:2581-6207(-)